jgi:hypothetical protein
MKSLQFLYVFFKACGNHSWSVGSDMTISYQKSEHSQFTKMYVYIKSCSHEMADY